MDEEQRQQFFAENGYWPTTYVPVAPRVKKASTSFPRSTTNALDAMRSARLALRGWRQPLHWTEPPPFEKPGLVYEMIGHEAFCEQVRDYYEAIKDLHVEKAQLAHARWAIRACLRTFETHVRGFRKQSVGRKGSIFASGSGQEYSPATGYKDILTLPEVLVRDGRLVTDLQGYLRAYGVPERQWPVVERLIKAKLEQTWGVKCS